MRTLVGSCLCCVFSDLRNAFIDNQPDKKDQIPGLGEGGEGSGQSHHGSRDRVIRGYTMKDVEHLAGRNCPKHTHSPQDLGDTERDCRPFWWEYLAIFY